MNNLYLTGMMGSGKTTIGSLLAAWVQAEFIDLDELIVRREGKSIGEIFATQGEEAFRSMETAALKETTVKSYAIIATGGGAILKEENIEIMRNSGVIAFIDRPLAAILQDVELSTRPLIAGGKEKVKEIFINRIELYRSRCDIRVENTTTVDDAASLLQRLLYPHAI